MAQETTQISLSQKPDGTIQNIVNYENYVVGNTSGVVTRNNNTVPVIGIENAAAISGSDFISKAKDDIAANTTEVIKSGIVGINKSELASSIKDNRYKSPKGGRLVNFKYTSGDDDDSRRAYFLIEGDTSLLEKELQSRAELLPILSLLKSANGFINFILTGIAENEQERQSIIPTINDYFIATFSGREPKVINMSGMLPFDASLTESSWLIDFLNGFKYIFRASVLAKYKLKLVLIIPDLATYICYPTSITTNVLSSQDTLCQFTMGALVTEEVLARVHGIDSGIEVPETPAEEVEKNTEDTKKKEKSGENATPKEVGEGTSKKNFLDTALDFVNTCITGVGENKTALAINKVNKTLGATQQVTGAINTLTGSTYGKRLKIKTFF